MDPVIEICSAIGMGLVTEMITGAVTGLCQETQMTSGKNLESPWVAGEVVTDEMKEDLQAVIQIGAGEVSRHIQFKVSDIPLNKLKPVM